MPATQWTGQMPPSFAKWGVDSGCQSWVQTTKAPADRGHRDLAVDDRDDRVAATHGQAARRVGEVVLDVDDDEGRRGVVALHRTEPTARVVPGDAADVGDARASR